MSLNLKREHRQFWTVSLSHQLTAKKDIWEAVDIQKALTHALLEDFPKLS